MTNTTEKKVYDIEDIEQLTTSHEVQIANGDWFPVNVEEPDEDSDGDSFRWIVGSNQPDWAKRSEVSGRESLISLVCAGLITDIREIANREDPRDQIDMDALQMAEVYDEIEAEERTRAHELDMAKACVRKLNAHLHNLGE